MSHLTIAIDGPAGAGKSTVAREVARRLGILYIDTGAMYRGVAWLALHHGVAIDNEDALVNLLHTHPLTFEKNEDGGLDIFAQGRRINEELRNPEVSALVSQLSVYAGVRNTLTNWQQAFARQHAVVMDGRDIGTVVLPEARVKIYLTASLDERTKRRAVELRDKGHTVSEEVLAQSISERDERDSSRAVAPLRPADDAVHLDSTGKGIEQVVDEVLGLVRGFPS